MKGSFKIETQYGDFAYSHRQKLPCIFGQPLQRIYEGEQLRYESKIHLPPNAAPTTELMARFLLA